MSSSGMDRSNSSSILNINSMASRELRPKSSRRVCCDVIALMSCLSSFARVARNRSAISLFAVMRCLSWKTRPPMYWNRLVETFEHEGSIIAAEPKGVHQCDLDAPFLGGGGNARQATFGVGILVIDRRMDPAALQCHRRRDGGQTACCPERMADQ